MRGVEKVSGQIPFEHVVSLPQVFSLLNLPSFVERDFTLLFPKKRTSQFKDMKNTLENPFHKQGEIYFLW